MKNKLLAVLACFIFLGLVFIVFLRGRDTVLWDKGFGEYQARGPKFTHAQISDGGEEKTDVLEEIETPKMAAAVFDDSDLIAIESLVAIRKEECAVILESLLPNDGIVDPSHEIYSRRSDDIIATTMDVIQSFTSAPSVQVYEWIQRQVIDGGEYDAFELYGRLSSAEICYHPRGLTYLQVLLDAAELYQWPIPMRLRLGRTILQVIYDDILAFPSSNNLIFALSAVRSLGGGRFAVVEDREEVEVLSARVIDHFERAQQSLQEGVSSVEGRGALRELLDENDLLRQQIRDLIGQVLERSRL